MPHARIPNARLIASADHPLLPFLAPRVFAESPVRNGRVRHGTKTGTQKETETVSQGGFDIGTQSQKSNSSRLRREGAKNLTTQSRFRQERARTPASSHSPSLGLQSPFDAVHLRYADISAFARQHIRSYSTTESSRSTQSTISTKSDSLNAQTVAISTASTSLTSDPNLRPSPRNRNTRGRASRRAKALHVEHSRLIALIKARPNASLDDLLREGDYRSLRRRLINLRQWDTTKVDLSRLARTPTSPKDLLGAFAALDRKHYDTVKRHTRKIELLHHPKCVRWSATIFRGTTKLEMHQVWGNWMELSVEIRKSMFRPLLIYLLDRKPGRAMQFVHVVAQDPDLHGLAAEAIADTLGQLSKIHTNGIYGLNEAWGDDTAAARRNFVSAFVHVYRKALDGKENVCSQDLLYNIATLAESYDLRKWFDILVDSRTRIGFDTFLHYAHAFAKAGDIEYALQTLNHLKSRNTPKAWSNLVQRERLRWTCALILRKSLTESKRYHDTPTTVAAFVDLGVQMDIRLYNTVMHNAMDAGDYATAFKVYNALESNELKATNETYSILLHGCTLQANAATFAAFAKHCAEIVATTRDSWLASDYLYYLYVRHKNDLEQSNTAPIWHAYQKLFKLDTLQFVHSELRIPPLPANDPSEKLGLDPPPVAIYIMLQVTIQSLQKWANSRVPNVYERFKQHITHDPHSPLAKLAQNPIIWNAFLYAFCQKQQFSNASQLIKDMTERSPKPNIYTWNIFMQAFFKTGQVKAAERVFGIMRSRGIDPDQYSYGVLLRGYAKAQHVERVAETMNYLDTEEEMNPDILRALARLVDRKGLMAGLEKSRIEKEAAANKKAEKKEREDSERWENPFDKLKPVRVLARSSGGLKRETIAFMEWRKRRRTGLRTTLNKAAKG